MATYLERFITVLAEHSRKRDYKSMIEEWESLGKYEKAARDAKARDLPELPEQVDRCICTHKITDNRIIRNIRTGEYLIVGNCCIKKFEKSIGGRITKHCTDCEMIIRRLKSDLCEGCEAKWREDITTVTTRSTLPHKYSFDRGFNLTHAHFRAKYKTVLASAQEQRRLVNQSIYDASLARHMEQIRDILNAQKFDILNLDDVPAGACLVFAKHEECLSEINKQRNIYWAAKHWHGLPKYTCIVLPIQDMIPDEWLVAATTLIRLAPDSNEMADMITFRRHPTRMLVAEIIAEKVAPKTEAGAPGNIVGKIEEEAPSELKMVAKAAPKKSIIENTAKSKEAKSHNEEWQRKSEVEQKPAEDVVKRQETEAKAKINTQLTELLKARHARRAAAVRAAPGLVWNAY